MRRTFLTKCTSSFLVLSILASTFAPFGVRAEESSQLPDEPIQSVEETVADLSSTALAEESVPEVVEVAQTDNSTDVSANEVAQALEAMPDILEDSETVQTSTDSDSALVSTTEDTAIDVPKDPEQGITMQADGGPSIQIELPNAENAGSAKEVAEGVVAYPADNGSANAVQADAEGVRMLTVIDNAEAPTEYEYKVTVPGGGHIELTEEGGAIVLDEQGQVIAAVDVPWAKDANNMSLNTWFTTDGQTLIQHIDHRVEGVVYPVTADPFVIAAWVVRACGIGFLSGGAAYFVGGGNSWRRFLASGGVGCVFGILGKKW